MTQTLLTPGDRIEFLHLSGKWINLTVAEVDENGITTLSAYTLPGNRGMIKLFKRLPYKTKAAFKDSTVVLTCNFEPQETVAAIEAKPF